jgi:transcription antitermination protein NusB
VTSEEKPAEPARGRRPGGGKAKAAEVAARRHQGRMLSLQVLYEVDLTGHDVIAQVQRLVGGVLAQRAELDPVIGRAAPARPLQEQAAIERNVLRLAAYELTHTPDVPPKVAINEAVELAKRFGGENSGKFVNGVLRTLYEAQSQAGSQAEGNRR